MASTIYKMTPVPELGSSIDTLDSNTNPGQLEVVAKLEGESEAAKLLWQPNEGNKVLTVGSDSRINLWDFSNTFQVSNPNPSIQFLFHLISFNYQIISKSEPLVKVHNQVTAAGWSPHHGTNQVAIAMETNLQVLYIIQFYFKTFKLSSIIINRWLTWGPSTKEQFIL